MQIKLNTIVEGDCREVMKSIPDNHISACITDPPYNYEFIGHKWDDQEIQRRKDRVQLAGATTLVKNIPYGSGLSGGVRNERWYKKNRDNILEYQNWCKEWGKELFRICKPGATILIFNSSRTIAHVQVAMEDVGFYARDILVYKRQSGIPKGINFEKKLEKEDISIEADISGWHSCLRNEWESICVLQKPLKNNYIETFLEYKTGLFFTKQDDGGFQSNIFDNIKKDKNEEFNIHCTVKPLELMKRLVKVFAPRFEGSVILDPFAGSGTTLLAAKSMNIDYIGIEVEPKYVQIAKERLSSAELQGTLQLF